MLTTERKGTTYGATNTRGGTSSARGSVIGSMLMPSLINSTEIYLYRPVVLNLGSADP